jgi:cytochrome c oxidase subunit 2
VLNLIGFLEQASSDAGKLDGLFFALTMMTVFFSALIFVGILYFATKYRRGNKVDRSNAPHEGLAIELTWTIIPFLISMCLFVWATTLYFHVTRPAKGAMDIYVVGKQWMWKIQQPQGRWEMNELHVPLGKPVKLTMTSEDVIHSFFIPAFRIKQDVFPGLYTQMQFTPTKLGTYHLFCAEFCGTNHSGMVGTVTVMDPADYNNWLNTGTNPVSQAAVGERLFVQHGCSGCHSGNGSIRAPSLVGIYGHPVAVQIPRPGQRLADTPATTLIADDRYIHDSIVLPEKEIAGGFKPIMPTFKNKLSEEQIFQIITYIKSLGSSNGGINGNSRGKFNEDITPEEIKSRAGFEPSNMGDITRASRQHPENESPEPVPNGNRGGSGTSNTQGTSNGGSQ